MVKEARPPSLKFKNKKKGPFGGGVGWDRRHAEWLESTVTLDKFS